MKTATWTDNASWDDVLRRAEGEDGLVFRNGQPVVLMTPSDDDDLPWHRLAPTGGSSHHRSNLTPRACM